MKYINPLVGADKYTVQKSTVEISVHCCFTEKMHVLRCSYQSMPKLYQLFPVLHTGCMAITFAVVLKNDNTLHWHQYESGLS